MSETFGYEPLSEKRLAEIELRMRRRKTGCPWVWTTDYTLKEIERPGMSRYPVLQLIRPAYEGDKELIAHAPDDLIVLWREVKRLRERLAQYEPSDGGQAQS